MNSEYSKKMQKYQAKLQGCSDSAKAVMYKKKVDYYKNAMQSGGNVMETLGKHRESALEAVKKINVTIDDNGLKSQLGELDKRANEAVINHNAVVNEYAKTSENYYDFTRAVKNAAKDVKAEVPDFSQDINKISSAIAGISNGSDVVTEKVKNHIIKSLKDDYSAANDDDKKKQILAEAIQYGFSEEEITAQ